MHMRLPKLRGFKNPAKVEFQVVNLDKLSSLFPEGGDVTVADLVEKAQCARTSRQVLGTGEITVAPEHHCRQVLRLRGREDQGCRRKHQRGLIRSTGTGSGFDAGEGGLR